MDLREVREFFLDTFQYFIVVIVVLFLIIYVVSVQQVVGPSMHPTLKDGDVLILNKAAYNFFDIKRGHVVALKYDNSKFLIKRVIGLPGDSIKFVDDKLYINDEVVEEEYIKNMNTEDFNMESLGYKVVPKNMYFVLGDNRSNSLDSRKIGVIKQKDIIGRVSVRIWPINGFKLF